MEKGTSIRRPEIWGGIECTINRVNDRFFDQLEFAGHYERLSDLEVIAQSGIRTLRIPILWERHQPDVQADIPWDWTARMLEKLDALGITPIAGLLHHGSGPAFTNLSDPHFPALFANYARRVAERFPFIDHYTPINEPLTTARFSGLYGHWYPHRRSSYDFAKMLMNQLKGIVLAMKAIRQINPNAKLVQTEDLGKTYSTPVLDYQARFENERRWLTYDFLFGKIDQSHPMYRYFLSLGFSEDELSFLLTCDCRPDIVGVNYYVTSERFLDDRVELYPFAAPGGNGRHRYVDVEAIRVKHDAEFGLEVLLRECWQRYHSEIAITEVHLNSSREHQLRWFQRALDTAQKLNGEGIPIKAVTAWALLGAFGWDKLVTEPHGRYENGVFDIRSGEPRPTALSRLISSYNRNDIAKHPVVEGEGWWETPSRFFHAGKTCTDRHPSYCRPLLIISKGEGLGTAVADACLDRSLNYLFVTPPQHELPGIAIKHIEQTIEHANPWAIIYVADYGDIDAAESDVERCNRENVELPFQIARACNRNGIQMLTFSSDLVFDGQQRTPYLEHDDVSPINVYGESKAKAEAGILSVFRDALIVRASAVFGGGDPGDYARKIVAALETERRVPVADNITVSPTYVPDLINASLDLLIDGENSIWHVCNAGSVTWADFAAAIASGARKDKNLLMPTSGVAFKAPRPAFSVLNTVKGVVLPSLENAIDRYCETISVSKR